MCDNVAVGTRFQSKRVSTSPNPFPLIFSNHGCLLCSANVGCFYYSYSHDISRMAGNMHVREL